MSNRKSDSNKYLQWIPASQGQVPDNAIQGGRDGGPLYVGRIHHAGDLLPGKVQPYHGSCYASYAGKEVWEKSYEVLCNRSQCQISWVSTRDGNIPPGAIQGGKTNTGEPLYVGRARHQDTLTIGKVHPSHGCLYIPYGGKEHNYTEYEILVCRG